MLFCSREQGDVPVMAQEVHSHLQLQGEKNSPADGADVRYLCGNRGFSASALLAVAFLCLQHKYLFLPLRGGIVQIII